MTKVNAKFYLVPGETPPHKLCKSKSYITKFLFMHAVSRPRWDSHANHYFDGKIGIWIFIFKEPVKRSSKNFPSDTMGKKCITSFKRMDMTKIFVEKVIPAVKKSGPSDQIVVLFSRTMPSRTRPMKIILSCRLCNMIVFRWSC